MVLKGVPPAISPDLMHALMSMGHGDEIVLADSNFPAASHATKLIRADGIDVPTLLDAILTFFPLDTYVTDPVCVMGVVPGDKVYPAIWNTYQSIVQKHEGDWVDIVQVERFAFYDRAKKAYAIVATGETAIYANVILKKGVVKPQLSSL